MAETEIAAAPAAAGVQTTTAEPSGFLSALRKELRPKDQAAEARISRSRSRLALAAPALSSRAGKRSIQLPCGSAT